jgi:hypothetical protein
MAVVAGDAATAGSGASVLSSQLLIHQFLD